ncbi:NB-ARC domain-containing protein [Actinoplanes sp. TFC3]|uniref:NB-ARC domain-containing protein n=1 Tax=Actinoplanes sp. TFC3 TaxID=1710355 RepID=UPI00082FEB2D|nr:NB-ARC domain-containing protein [Actinoplanes sp. TFC3]
MALHELYAAAGKPSVRMVSRAIHARNDMRDHVSHETMSAMLRGRNLPRWSKAESVARQLADWSAGETDGERVLRDLYQLWLRAEDVRESSPEGDSLSPVSHPPASVSSTKPAAENHFVGRRDALRQLEDWISHDEKPIVLITGSPGVGKSALLNRFVEASRSDFPDGILLTDLHDRQQLPRAPSDVLGGLLSRLGVAPTGIPPELPDRVSLYRALLTGRRTLVAFDNADTAEQLRPLLPAVPGPRVLVATRRAMHGVAAREGAATLALASLPHDEAIEVLTVAIGADRVRQEPADADAIVELCGGLPLALRIAGAQLAVHPNWSLRELRRRLTDARIDTLSLDDPLADIGVLLEGSLSAVSSAATHLLRELSMRGPEEFEIEAVQTLLGADGSVSERLVNELSNVSLISGPDQRGKYFIHDLVRAFIREKRSTAQ